MRSKLDRTPLALMVIDGLGLSTSWQGNAFLMSKPENFASLWYRYPHKILRTTAPTNANNDYYSDPAVNHAVLGTGSFYSPMADTIDESIQSNTLRQNEILLESLENAEKHYSSIHLFFTLSDNTRYSSDKHLYELIKNIDEKRITNAFLHLFIDGSFRNVDAVIQKVQKIEDVISRYGCKIATIVGQKTSLNNSMNLAKWFKALVLGQAKHALSAEQAILLEKNLTPDSLEPYIITANGAQIGKVSDFDSIIMVDHFSQPYALAIATFFEDTGVIRGIKFPKFLNGSGISSPFHVEKKYFKSYFPAQTETSITKIIANSGIKQVYVTESSRAAQVNSFFQANFFSSLVKNIYYDTDMNYSDYLHHYPNICGQILNKMVEVARHPEKSLVYFELPFLDIIAHKGKFDNVVDAAKLLDEILKKLEYISTRLNVPLIITSNYGKIEKIQSKENSLYDEKTANPVPLIFIDQAKETCNRSVASFNSQLTAELVQEPDLLIDVAPTILELLDIDQPSSISGKSLLAELRA